MKTKLNQREGIRLIKERDLKRPNDFEMYVQLSGRAKPTAIHDFLAVEHGFESYADYTNLRRGEPKEDSIKAASIQSFTDQELVTELRARGWNVDASRTETL